MKFLFSILIISISLIGISKECSAQLLNDIQRAQSIFAPPEKTNFKEFAKGNKNEIESTFSAMFLFYKTFISSQDIDACVFYPTCSVYAIECIHLERRKIVAFLKISDRLMRCHPLISKGSYKIDYETGRYSDPVKN